MKKTLIFQRNCCLFEETYRYYLFREGDRLDFYGEVWEKDQRKECITEENLIFRDWFCIRVLDLMVESFTHPCMFSELIYDFDVGE